jgi:hypothetical protein
MGPLLIKPAEMMLFYTGADNANRTRRKRQTLGQRLHWF